MKDSERLTHFLAQYEEYVKTSLQPTRDELKAVLKAWKQPGYWGKYTKKSRLPDPSPVQRTFSRIKRPESVVDKILRKPADFSDGLSAESFRRMNDALGARAIVYFMSNLPLVDREVRSMDQLEISKEHPPVAYLRGDIAQRLSLVHLNLRDKESGYASIHYVVRLTQSAVPKDSTQNNLYKLSFSSIVAGWTRQKDFEIGCWR